MMKISDLPRDIKLLLFGFLTPKELKTSVMVNKEWRNLGEEPRLWSWCVVTISTREDIHNLAMRRLRQVQEICAAPGVLWEPSDLDAMFQATLRLPRLKKINGLNANFLSSVEPGLLGRALIRLEEVDLDASEINPENMSNFITFEQMNIFITYLAQEDTKLKKLNLKVNNLSNIKPECLAKAVNKLEDVDLSNTELIDDQMTTIFTCIAQEDSKLKGLNLFSNDLSRIEPQVLTKAVIKLEAMDLGYTELRAEHMIGILMLVKQGDQKLKTLKLEGIDLDTIEPALLVQAINRLEDVDLSYTYLRNAHKTSIIAYLAEKVTKLRRLSIKGHNMPFSTEPDIFARAINKLEVVNLKSCYMSNYCMNSICTHVTQGDSKLKRINLSTNILSRVEPEVLAKAVNQLEDVDLGHTELNNEQMASILTCIAQEDTKLKRLTLADNNLSAIEPEILARAVNRLEDVDLSRTQLSPEQMTSLCTQRYPGIKHTNINKLNLSGNDMSRMEMKVLTRAINRLDDVDLSNTKLNAEQISAILARAAQKDKKIRRLNLEGNYCGSIEVPKVLLGVVRK